jgi:hypothetical protein
MSMETFERQRRTQGANLEQVAHINSILAIDAVDVCTSFSIIEFISVQAELPHAKT